MRMGRIRGEKRGGGAWSKKERFLAMMELSLYFRSEDNSGVSQGGNSKWPIKRRLMLLGWPKRI